MNLKKFIPKAGKMNMQEQMDMLIDRLEEIESENTRLKAKLGQVLLSIDIVKEMNAMCDIDGQRKQAVKEFAEKLKAALFDIFGTAVDNLDSMEDITYLIDEQLKGYEK